MTAPRTGLLRDVRGAAIYVELLIIVPLIALLWMSALYVHRLGESSVQTQRRVRECAWAFAASGCRDLPPGCEMAGPTPLDGEVDRVAGRGLESGVRPIQTLPPFFRSPAASEAVATGTGTVARPPFLGGTADRTGMNRMLCNERLRQPALQEVFDKTCEGMLGAGGDCK